MGLEGGSKRCQMDVTTQLNNFGSLLSSLAGFAVHAVLSLAALVTFWSWPSRRTGISWQSGWPFHAGLTNLAWGSDAASRSRFTGTASFAVLSSGSGRALQSWLALFSRLTGQSSQSHLGKLNAVEEWSGVRC